ncbi:MAG: multidrug resistance efflux pump, partial [Kiritimatiellia bacterium]
GWGISKQTTVEVRGIAQARTMHVAALQLGRVGSIPFALHDVVEQGDVIASLDDGPLQGERKVAAADLLAIQERLTAEVADRSRRYAQASEGALLDRARLTTDLAEDQSRMDTLREELKLEQSLVDKGAGAGRTVAELRWRLEVLQARVSTHRITLSAATNAVGGTGDRQTDMHQPLEWQIIAATRRLEMVEGNLTRLQLRAEFTGRVTWIHHQAGDVVPAGEPILDISEPTTRQIVGYLPTGLAGQPNVGDSARVIRASGQSLMAKVHSVGLDVRQLPTQLQRNPAAPEWGVPIRVELVGDDKLGPNEPVTLRL